MKNVLGGNYTPAKPVIIDDRKPSLETQFEREALKRLGGSIAFVSNKTFLWRGEKKEQ